MIRLVRTDSSNPGFIELVKHLDAELAFLDGEEHTFYSQFNKIDKIKHVVVANLNKVPLACGAIKVFDSKSMEVKRMFVLPEFRGKGIATKVLAELESWASELGYESCLLETGKRQIEAIELYRKSDYVTISNYGQYVGIDNSLCFEKKLNDKKI